MKNLKKFNILFKINLQRNLQHFHGIVKLKYINLYLRILTIC
jgi:hypothetical protein